MKKYFPKLFLAHLLFTYAFASDAIIDKYNNDLKKCEGVEIGIIPSIITSPIAINADEVQSKVFYTIYISKWSL